MVFAFLTLGEMSLISIYVNETAIIVIQLPYFLSAPKQSEYFARKEKLLEKWDEIRDKLVYCRIEQSCITENQPCTNCNEEIAEIRCLDCGYQSYFCQECAVLIHSTRNFFHCPEKWKVGLTCVHLFDLESPTNYCNIFSLPLLSSPKGLVRKVSFLE